MDKQAETVIWLRGICKQYAKNQVLTNFSMTAYKGTIYALLGASGCGKTTLLSTIVGSKRADKGEIRVLGCCPGERPDNIGYMPQEVALVDECTITDVLQHFGWLYGMKQSDIDERIKFFQELLELPPVDSFIKNLSGGQKRRVSLAVALIHNPQVLILDEPTVGVDPELRQQIWNYLNVLATKEGKTVIITTHYIEEARFANVIGLMRNGRLLIEDEPESLLRKFNCNNVEEVFLHLSRQQDDDKLEYFESHSSPINEHRSKGENAIFRCPSHAKALVSKNLLKFVRNRVSLAFFFLLPVVLAILLLTAVGKNPSKALGILNHELGEYKDCESFAGNNSIIIERMDDSSCHLRGLSCLFLQTLPSELRNHIYYQTEPEAREAVKKRHAALYLEFHSNFSRQFERSRENVKMTSRELDQQQINIYEDKTDMQISLFMEKSLYETYEKFTEIIESNCGNDIRAGQLPMHKYPPVYSTKENTYTEFIAPGCLVTFSIVLTIIYSSMTIVTERGDGFWDRTLVAGVSKTEIMLWHFITIAVLTAFQNLVMFIVIFFIFGMHCEGSVYTALGILIFQGFSATAMGMMFSVTSKNITDCIQLSTGMGMPLFILSGCVWPLEGMPSVLRYTCYYLIPSTISVEALANVIHRGWSLENLHVAKGFCNSTMWCAIYLLINVIVLKYEKR